MLAKRVNPATLGSAGTHFVVELLDERYRVMRTAYDTPAYSFARLRPGLYRVRIIIDANNNRKRDIGNVQKGLQPERIIYNLGSKIDHLASTCTSSLFSVN